MITNSIEHNPEVIRNLLNKGVEYSKEGQFDKAISCFNEVLKINPNDADALHLSGVVAANQKKFEDAKNLIGQAISLKPEEGVFHVNLANVFLEEGQIDQAIKSYYEALQLQPANTDILNKLALSSDKLFQLAIKHYQDAEFDKADEFCQQVLEVRPDRADAWNLSGVIAHAQGEFSTGIEHIHRAITIAPNEANFHNNLGAILASKGGQEAAIECFKRAINLEEGFLDAKINLALALYTLGRVDPAIDLLRQVIAVEPSNVTALVKLSTLLRVKGELEEAEDNARRAVKLAPGDASSHSQLSKVLRSKNQMSEAILSCRRSLELMPKSADNNNTLAMLLKDQGHINEALTYYRQALDLKPDNANIHSNMLFTLHYTDPYDAKLIFNEHRDWALRHSTSSSAMIQFTGDKRNPDKRLRIGYVSADFRSHSVGFFIEPLLTARDQNSFEVICYNNSLVGDITTVRLKECVDRWRDIGGLSDEKAYSLICLDEIDILVDLSGHTRLNRIPLFTRKPAPIQVTYLGYPNTTGIDSMDYRFTDEWADPPGQTEEYHTEKLFYLRGGFLCYRPLDNCPEVSPLPMLKSGNVTFGSFNNLAKVSPTTISLWAKVLTAVTNSRLLLKSKPLADSDTQNYIRKQFRKQGIEADRIEMIGWTKNKEQHIGLYSRIDIGLDTFPYNGTATTCEALWMGVPVITLTGKFHLSRVGNSLLHSSGLTDLIAETQEEYVSKALELASDTAKLKELRASLRDKVKASSLTDAKRIANSIESAYRDMWLNFCSETKPEPS